MFILGFAVLNPVLLKVFDQRNFTRGGGGENAFLSTTLRPKVIEAPKFT